MKSIVLLVAFFLFFSPFLAGNALHAQEDKADPALELYYGANGLYNRKLYPLAVDQYKEFLSKYPKHAKAPMAELGLALSLFSLGNFDEAEPALRKLSKNKKLLQIDQVRLMHAQALTKLDRMPDAEDAFALAVKTASDDTVRQNALAGLVDALYRQKKWEPLAERGSVFLKSAPEGALAERVRYQSGVARYEAKDYAGAVKILKPYETGLKKSPFSHLALFLLAQSNRLQEDLKAAADLYDQVADQEDGPYAKDAMFLEGFCRFNLKDYASAAKDLSAFIKKGEGHASFGQGYVLLGRSYLEQKDYQKAVKALKKAITLEPVSAEASLWLARGQVALNKPADAEAVLDAALRKSPDAKHLPALLLDYANLLLTQDKFEAAAAPYQRFIKECADHQQLADAMRQRAYCLHRAEKYPESIQACDAFMASFSKNEHAHEVAYMRAENFYLNKQRDEAVQALLTFLGGYPGSPRADAARFRAGQILYEQEKWADAVKTLEPLIGKKTDDPIFNQTAYLAGACCFKIENWDQAIGHLEQFVKLYPKEDNADLALFTAGMAYQRKNDPENAIKTLGRFPGLFPKSDLLAQALTEMGRMQYERKQMAAARTALGQVIGKHPNSPHVPTALYYLGWTEHAENNGEAAAGYFGNLAEKYAKHELAPDARLQQGLIFINLKKFAEAETALGQFLGSWPKHDQAQQALFQLGTALARQEKWEPALARFKQVGKDSDWHAQSMYESAWCSKELGRPADAISLYKQLIAAYPKEAIVETASFELAELEYQNKQYAEAGQRLETLLLTAKDPGLRERALYRLGWCHFDQGALLKAAPPFEQLIQESPESDLVVPSSFQAGECRLKLKEYPKALEHFNRAVTLERKKSALTEQSLLRLGEVQGLVAQWKASEVSYEEFVQKFPKSELLRRAWFGLGWARENGGGHAPAIEAYRNVTAAGIKDETAARCQFQIGECYLAQKNYDQAIKEFINVEVNYAYPKYSSKALLEMGVCLERKEDTAAALERYREIVEKYPDTEAAKVAQQALKQQR